MAMTDAPFFAATYAAVMPAPPVPMTMTSAVFTISSAAGAWASTFAVISSSVKPRRSSAVLVASSTALLASVQPALTSTATDCAATISPGRLLIAGSATPGVSLFSSTSTETICLPSTVTSTVSSPPKPLAVPVAFCVSAAAKGIAISSTSSESIPAKSIFLMVFSSRK